MRDKRRFRTGWSWLAVTGLSIALVSGFVLVGGLNTSQGSVALARSSGDGTSSTSTSATSSSVSGPTSSSGLVAGISTDACTGRSLAGILTLNDKLTGQVILGLFALSQHEMPLARQFLDTGQRVAVLFQGTTSSAFLFPVVPGGAVDYFVAVVAGDGSVSDATQVVESAVLPLCGTRKVTVTTTVTTTVISTSTSTSTVSSSEAAIQNSNVLVVVTSSSFSTTHTRTCTRSIDSDGTDLSKCHFNND